MVKGKEEGSYKEGSAAQSHYGYPPLLNPNFTRNARKFGQHLPSIWPVLPSDKSVFPSFRPLNRQCPPTPPPHSWAACDAMISRNIFLASLRFARSFHHRTSPIGKRRDTQSCLGWCVAKRVTRKGRVKKVTKLQGRGLKNGTLGRNIFWLYQALPGFTRLDWGGPYRGSVKA